MKKVLQMQDFFYFCSMESSFLFLNFLGTGEFVLIAFVFLLLFGPDKIPDTHVIWQREFVELKMLVMILNMKFIKVQRV